MAFDDVPNNGGTVLAERHLALYRDPQGKLHALSSVCPHRGCDVDWNDSEKIWDCPCHGSQFKATGEVLRGPAMEPLKAAEPPKEPAPDR
jgi:Rieske Fe-S protein